MHPFATASNGVSQAPRRHPAGGSSASTATVLAVIVAAQVARADAVTRAEDPAEMRRARQPDGLADLRDGQRLARIGQHLVRAGEALTADLGGDAALAGRHRGVQGTPGDVQGVRDGLRRLPGVSEMRGNVPLNLQATGGDGVDAVHGRAEQRAYSQRDQRNPHRAQPGVRSGGQGLQVADHPDQGRAHQTSQDRVAGQQPVVVDAVDLGVRDLDGLAGHIHLDSPHSGRRAPYSRRMAQHRDRAALQRKLPAVPAAGPAGGGGHDGQPQPAGGLDVLHRPGGDGRAAP
jgi:hypothetical protein